MKKVAAYISHTPSTAIKGAKRIMEVNRNIIAYPIYKREYVLGRVFDSYILDTTPVPPVPGKTQKEAHDEYDRIIQEVISRLPSVKQLTDHNKSDQSLVRFRKNGTEKWPWRLEQDLTFRFCGAKRKFVHRHEWFEVTSIGDGFINVHVAKGYCWDGATCFPDFKWIMMPSLLHDVLYQHNKLFGFDVISRNKADCLLSDFIKAPLSPLTNWAVYLGVRIGYPIGVLTGVIDK